MYIYIRIAGHPVNISQIVSPEWVCQSELPVYFSMASIFDLIEIENIDVSPYICIHLYTHTFVYTHTYIYIHTSIDMYVCVFVSVGIYT